MTVTQTKEIWREEKKSGLERIFMRLDEVTMVIKVKNETGMQVHIAVDKMAKMAEQS